MPPLAMLGRIERICRRAQGKTMDLAAQTTGSANDDVIPGGNDHPDFGFLPQNLIGQCRSLIEGYHGLHGHSSLPDILWKAGLGPFIESHREFRRLLKKASTTRSAKKSNEGFTQIATTLLSLEILASNFAGWSAIYPQAASKARAILRRHTRHSRSPLMDSYLYPPKYMSSAAIATLAPPARQEAAGSEAVTPQRPSSDLQTAGLPIGEMSEPAVSSMQR
jgi:hypothetical protein